MIVRLTATFACLLIFASGLFAQKPENIQAHINFSNSQAALFMCDRQDAGTVASITAISAQSNQIGLGDVTYLCLGDEVAIDHANDFNLSDSPDSRDAGIAYAFLDCNPSATGPNLTTILNDPCINTKSPILFNGMLTNQTHGIWVAAENSNGDINFNHDGQLLTAFTGGRAGKEFWFAPITIDTFATRGFYQDPSTGELGTCVNMRADQAFPVVYLAPIEANNPAIGEIGGNCTGSFEARGGLPQFDNSESYAITIENTTTGSFGTVTSGAAGNGDIVEFTVPEYGTYRITVEDGRSCSKVFDLEFVRCNGITSYSDSDIVQPGDMVCVDVRVFDFTDVSSLQYTIEWDSMVLEFVSLDAGALPISVGDYNQLNNSQIAFSWFSPGINSAVTLADGTAIYRLCFRAIGQIGESSEVTFSSDVVDIEVTDRNQVKIGLDNSITGRISITNQAIDLQFEIDTACHSQTDGALEIFPIGGTPPYQITYRNITATPPQTPQGPFPVNNAGGSIKQNGLGAATYEVEVTDSSTPQESFTTTIDVVEREQLVPVINELQSISCTGEADGVLIVNLTLGGTPVTSPGNEYQYIWNTSDETRVISNLGAQTYSVAVTDQFGCTVNDTEPLVEPTTISIIGSTTQASCSGVDDGGLQFDVQGGTPAPGSNYDIVVVGPSMVPLTQTGDRLNISTGIIAGRYDITITDDNNCTLDTFLIVTAQKTLSLTTRIIDNVDCAGGNDGQIFVDGVTNGGPAATPYTFTWIGNPPIPSGNISNTATSSSVNMLSVGTYSVAMTDMDGCRLDTVFMISEPDSIRITLVSKQNETCNLDDGTAEIRATGGTVISGYTFDWGVPGQTGSSVSGLSPGNYILTVTDDNMCSATLAFNIAAYTPAIVTVDDFQVLCSDDRDGVLGAVVSGLAPGVTVTNYIWSNSLSGATRDTIRNLAPDEYSVIVTTSDGCEIYDTAFVTAPDPLVIDSVSITPPICPGNGGIAIAHISGGNMPYDIRWSPNSASPGAPVYTDLLAGDYSVTVFDANTLECPSAEAMFTITDPPSIVIDTSIQKNISCRGVCDGSVEVQASYSDGSAGSFSFTWSSGETDINTATSLATMLCDINSHVIVDDGVCPPTAFEITIPENEALSASVSSNPVSCFGLSDGDATVTVSGGEMPYSYTWLNTAGAGATATGLAADTFYVDIEDVNGCDFSTSVIITEPDEFMVDIDPDNTQDATCNDGEDGIISVVTTGGNPSNLTYVWSPATIQFTGGTASNLFAGTYSVTVTDNEGCEASLSHNLSEPPPITFSLDPIESIQCFGFTTSISIADVSGGNGPAYSYSVGDGLDQDTAFASTVFAGTYTITVYDSRDCSAELDTTIIQPNPVTINIDPVIEVELGDSLQLRPQYNPGGVPIDPDSIFWEPAMFLSCDRCPNPTVRPIDDQLYTITAYDINGCPGFAEVLIEVDKNRNIFLPNAFSPNGDGVNDEFRVFTGLGVEKINFVRIFDRWGNIVHAQTDIEPNISGIPTWDGLFKGKQVDPGVFVYLVEVEFEDGLKLLYRGDLTLLR